MYKIVTSAFEMIPKGLQGVAKSVSKFLTTRGIPHAVAGGMAVGAYSAARATEDVDLVIPADAESVVEELAQAAKSEVVRGVLQGEGGITVDILTVTVKGVAIDFLLIPEGLPEDLLEGSPNVSGLPVLKPEALFVMKMVAGRTKDVADIVEMLKSGRVDKDEIVDYFNQAGMESLIEDLEAYAMLAAHEKAGKSSRAATTSVLTRKKSQ